MAYVPREEQEIIISLDRELNEWYYYSDVPTLNRKWRNHVQATRETVEENGQITLLEGTITGNVIIKAKQKLTDEQKAVNAERLRIAREAKINS